MAKGRKQGNRHERLLGYNQGNQVVVSGGGGAGGGGSDGSELGEEDVWSIVHDDDDHVVMNRDDYHMRHVATSEWTTYRGTTESNGHHHHRIQNGRRWISRGGLSLAFDESANKNNNIHDDHQQSSRIVHQQQRVNHHHHHHHTAAASSAPVNVPDWSKILRVNSVESLHDSDEGMDDDDGSERIPPHEYLAREYERSRKMRGTSVFQGVGRTLKGRDMSRVRDAVWSQTGFDG